ncbi:MAG: hypothetical protein Nk1A_8170 [Endomicrobiia bacterium]|nr:MAG: hypothetical protein Nk1A_8170 [Endomicrobiia bacterium]
MSSKANNAMYLGNKYSKIVLNPTKPDFISMLYKSIAFTYLEHKIQNKGTISNLIE